MYQRYHILQGVCCVLNKKKENKIWMLSREKTFGLARFEPVWMPFCPTLLTTVVLKVGHETFGHFSCEKIGPNHRCFTLNKSTELKKIN